MHTSGRHNCKKQVSNQVTQARIPRLLHHMNQVSARRVPVEKDGEVVGIITFDDLVVHLAGESEHVAAQLESLADIVHAESPQRD
jgi:CBS domain-containing protein